MTPRAFFAKALPAAYAAKHIWPEYAACEAALESGWGTSRLAREANNLFGQKRGFTTKNQPTISIPTREFLDGKWVIVPAEWACFATWEDSFAARRKLLRRKPAYASALAAKDGEAFVREVSKVWATDPGRAEKVLAIWRQHLAATSGPPERKAV
jgi:flagellum-specific peptidoglycan hydrolase FlgJ